MGICLEFVFLQIFKSRSGPRAEFNNNFSERSGLGTDFIFHKHFPWNISSVTFPDKECSKLCWLWKESAEIVSLGAHPPNLLGAVGRF